MIGIALGTIGLLLLFAVNHWSTVGITYIVLANLWFTLLITYLNSERVFEVIYFIASCGKNEKLGCSEVITPLFKIYTGLAVLNFVLASGLLFHGLVKIANNFM